uniref:Uncharacterized protein n=1 Tax=Amphora coffeiformis TaxID=265554 RepID=A0A7S3L129_9STRA|mmetsp:Transcript_17013/g.32289  ORF Transcript_17013/g.32289 Transcript_17013/m.32289 type:complete len:127 (+) Transcript_17013:69-449(+)|eukprot:scaffold2880_cov173-Amphora_coffeaeformis.AAC.3
MTKHEDKKSNAKKDAKGGDKKKKEQAREPEAPPTTSTIYPEGFRIAENISKKDKQKLEKILANIEYAEAHGNDADANKLREKLKQVNNEARATAVRKAERAATAPAGTTTVVHSGRKPHAPKVQAA